MTVTYTAQFSSSGAFDPTDQLGPERKFFEFYRWWNQIGNGVGVEFNLYWFFFSLEFVFAPKKEVSDGEV